MRCTPLVVTLVFLAACGGDGGGGTEDAGTVPDAAPADLGGADAGPADGALADAGPPDAGPPDGGPVDLGTDAAPPACEEGTTRCGDASREICLEGAFVAEPCGEAERCVPSSGAATCRCDFGTPRCAGDVRQVCSADGIFEDASCSADRVCRVIDEVPICVVCAPGERRCQGDAREVCDDAGNWNPDACAVDTVCRAIEGMAECTEPCTPGATRCAGPGALETCAPEGYWSATACAATAGCWEEGGAAACVEGCDPSDPPRWYPDGDSDGFGGGAGVATCLPPAGYVSVGGDCNDGNGTINPGAQERCASRNVDDDCDGMFDLEPGADCRGQNWNDFYFVGRDLTGIDLRNPSPQTFENDFSGATLDGANLAGVTFIASDFSGTSFVGADLSGGQFTSVTMDDADFTDANLQGRLWQGVSAQRVTFERADLTNGTLTGVTIVNGSGDGMILRSAALAGAVFQGGTWANVVADGASFNGSGFQMATLTDCSFEFTEVLGGFYLNDAVVNRCSLDGSHGYGVQLEDSILTDVTYREVDWENVYYERNGGSGLVWDGARMVDLRVAGASVTVTGTGARLQIVSGAAATLSGSLRGLVLQSGTALGGLTFDADLRASDLSAATAGTVAFTGSDLTGATLPGALGSVSWGTATCPNGSAAPCSGAQLVPTPCADDALEPNDVAVGAPAPSGSLVACGDADFFDLGAVSGSRLTVSFAFSAAGGGLRVHVLSADGQYVQGMTLGASGDLVVTNPPSGTYHLFVAGEGNPPMSYTVSTVVTP